MAASSRTDWALWRRQAWLCSDKDILNSASHYLHFFFFFFYFPASTKLKGMQISISERKGTIMSWNNGVGCSLSKHGSRLDCQDFTEWKGERANTKGKNLIETKSGRHMRKMCSCSFCLKINALFIPRGLESSLTLEWSSRSKSGEVERSHKLR